jgi:hypothetical protein
MEPEIESPQPTPLRYEQEHNREPAKPSALNSLLPIGGLIVGFIVTVFSLFGIHTTGVVYGLVGEVGLILALALPGLLIGLLVFRGFEQKISSRTVLIAAATLGGIVGGL